MRFFFWSGLLTVPRHQYRVSDWRRGRPIRLALRIRTFMGESPAPCWWPTVPKKKKDKKTHTHTHKGPRRIGGFQRKQKPNQTKKNEQPTETATVPFVFRCVNSLRQQRRRRRIFFYWLARINQISFGKSFELNFTALDRVLLDLTGFLPNCTRPLNRVKWSKRKLNGTTLLASLSIYLFFFDPLRTIFQTNYWVSNAVTLRSPTRTGFFQTNDVLPSFT